jgi:hypothetical protein
MKMVGSEKKEGAATARTDPEPQAQPHHFCTRGSRSFDHLAVSSGGVWPPPNQSSLRTSPAGETPLVPRSSGSHVLLGAKGTITVHD